MRVCVYKVWHDKQKKSGIFEPGLPQKPPLPFQQGLIWRTRSQVHWALVSAPHSAPPSQPRRLCKEPGPTHDALQPQFIHTCNTGRETLLVRWSQQRQAGKTTRTGSQSVMMITPLWRKHTAGAEFLNRFGIEEGCKRNFSLSILVFSVQCVKINPGCGDWKGFFFPLLDDAKKSGRTSSRRKDKYETHSRRRDANWYQTALLPSNWWHQTGVTGWSAVQSEQLAGTLRNGPWTRRWTPPASEIRSRSGSLVLHKRGQTLGG